jgi:hypothetical protein
MDEAGDAWLDDELSGCNLADERLTKRLRKLLEQMEGARSAARASSPTLATASPRTSSPTSAVSPVSSSSPGALSHRFGKNG